MKIQPTVRELIIPSFQALKSLGGKAKNSEITCKVIEIMEIPPHISKEVYNVGPKTILEYRLAWARSCLKKYGAICNSSKGQWSIVDESIEITSKNVSEVHLALNRAPEDKHLDSRVRARLAKNFSHSDN